jgi:hypothetical protein
VLRTGNKLTSCPMGLWTNLQLPAFSEIQNSIIMDDLMVLKELLQEMWQAVVLV